MDTGTVIRFNKFAGTVEMAQQVKGGCGRSWLPRPSFVRRWDPHDGRREQTRASRLLTAVFAEEGAQESHRQQLSWKGIQMDGWSSVCRDKRQESSQETLLLLAFQAT